MSSPRWILDAVMEGRYWDCTIIMGYACYTDVRDEQSGASYEQAQQTYTAEHLKVSKKREATSHAFKVTYELAMR